jgi:hypothetical protein
MPACLSLVGKSTEVFAPVSSDQRIIYVIPIQIARLVKLAVNFCCWLLFSCCGMLVRETVAHENYILRDLMGLQELWHAHFTINMSLTAELFDI